MIAIGTHRHGIWSRGLEWSAESDQTRPRAICSNSLCRFADRSNMQTLSVNPGFVASKLELGVDLKGRTMFLASDKGSFITGVVYPIDVGSRT